MLVLVDASTAASTSATAATTTTNTKKGLTVESMNQNVVKMEYAVRGAVVIEADRIKEELKKEHDAVTADTSSSSSSSLYPHFKKIVYTNIGNPQSVGQQPLTWPRQVLALVDLPDHLGVDHPAIATIFPDDAIRRAKEIKAIGLEGHGSGSYSHSKGVQLFRHDVVSFLQNRDGPMVPTNPEHIFLSNGASAAIANILTVLIADSTWYVRPLTWKTGYLPLTWTHWLDFGVRSFFVLDLVALDNCDDTTTLACSFLYFYYHWHHYIH